jgi:lipoprotein signal peptidase
MATIIGIWIAAGLTLCVFSFLYKDNPFYKFAEHLFVGVSAGYTIALTYHQLIKNKIVYPLAEADSFWSVLLVLIPTVTGLLMFSRFIPKYRWLIRWPLAFTIGIGAGASIPRIMQSFIFVQAEATLQPFTTINSIVITIGVLCTLIYFFFSVEHKGPVGVVSKIGTFFLMVSFGAAFGYTVMARISLLIGRIYFLLHDWLHIAG